MWWPELAMQFELIKPNPTNVVVDRVAQVVDEGKWAAEHPPESSGYKAREERVTIRLVLTSTTRRMQRRKESCRCFLLFMAEARYRRLCHSGGVAAVSNLQEFRGCGGEYGL
jgi:hypothetical protein